MRILVTGAPGWLGTGLVNNLLRKNENVNVLTHPNVDPGPIQKEGVEIIHGDITQRDNVKGVAKDVDVVIHLAGIIHPKKVKQFYSVNTEGTKNLLAESEASGVQRFVYVSSNSAQGVNVNRETLMKEEDSCHPYLNYGKSKLLAEQAVRSYQEKGAFETVIVRPCWFYGPGQPPRMTKLMQMIQQRKALMFGSGKNLRSMSYIDNIIQGLWLTATKPQAAGNTYWIADEQPYETIEIYRTIADLLGVELKFRHVPAFVSHSLEITDHALQFLGTYSINIHVGGEMPKNIACSIEKAKEELGYKPTVDLREGMQRSIEWARKQGTL